MMSKHIICFGDSNTHGYYPADNEKGYGRFDENQRWPGLLRKHLGEEYLVFEEGLTGRTTAFDDPNRESMNGLSAVYSCVMSHEPVDLLIVMLGTNDVKERFGLEGKEIAAGMKRLLRKAGKLPAWSDKGPQILLMAPPVIDGEWNRDYHRKSAEVALEYEKIAKENHWFFLNAGLYGQFNEIDHMHLTQESHARLAEKVTQAIRDIFHE